MRAEGWYPPEFNLGQPIFTDRRRIGSGYGASTRVAAKPGEAAPDRLAPRPAGRETRPVARHARRLAEARGLGRDGLVVIGQGGEQLDRGGTLSLDHAEA